MQSLDFLVRSEKLRPLPIFTRVFLPDSFFTLALFQMGVAESKELIESLSKACTEAENHRETRVDNVLSDEKVSSF